MSLINTSRGLWSRLNFRNWRISSKLLIVMVVLALAPVILVTVVGTQTGTNALVYQAQVNLTRLSSSTAQRVEQLLVDNQNYIRMIAGQDEVIYFLQTPVDKRSPKLYADLNYTIHLLLESNELINLASVFNNRGVVEAHTSPQYIGQDYSFRDYVKAALAGEAYTGGIQIGVLDGRPGILSSAPVTDSSGNVIGLISDRIDGDYISAILESTRQMDAKNLTDGDTQNNLEKIDIYLINQYGIVMSHSDPESDWRFRSLGTISSADSLAKIEFDKLLGGYCQDGSQDCPADQKIANQAQPIEALQDLRIELLQAMQAGETGTTIYCRPNQLDAAALDLSDCPADQEHIIGYAPVHKPGQEEALFMVVVDVPGSAFSQDIAAFSRQGITVAVIVGLVGLLVALLVARMLAKPILRLAQAAQEVEHDQPFCPEDISEVISLGDELGHLARVFSQMVLSLRARMTELRTIYEIGQEISAGVELEDTLRYILKSINQVIPYDMAELCFYDAAQKRMVTRAAANWEGVRYYEAEIARSYAADQGFQAYLRRTGKVLSIADLQADLEIQPDPARKWGDLEPRSYLGVALRAKGKVIGVIELISTRVNNFSDDNRRLLESIAVQASIEVQNAQEVQEREQRLSQQIQQMDVVIDKDKQKQQIDAIEDTEFFKAAMEKARRARK